MCRQLTFQLPHRGVGLLPNACEFLAGWIAELVGLNEVVLAGGWNKSIFVGEKVRLGIRRRYRRTYSRTLNLSWRNKCR